MKTILLLALIVATTSCSFAQVTATPAKPFTKADYLKKAKNQNTVAWLLVGGGTAIDIAAIIVELGTFNIFDESFKTYKRKTNTAGELFIGGTAAILGSIPFFIGSHICHKKATHVAIETQSFHRLKTSNEYTANFPVLALKIRL